MPTWRDYEFFIDSGFNFQQLNDELLKNDSIFLIKLHPSSVIDIDLSVYPALDVLPASLDIYPILPYTDVLVTDYSSIYYDYLILNKPIILFPFDREKYIEKDRGFIEDYFTAMPSPYFDTFEELLDGMFQELDVDDDKIMQIKRRKCGSVSSTAIPQIFDALP